MDLWAAFRRTTDRFKDGHGRTTNYCVAYCVACKDARARYLADVKACDGDEEAIAKIHVAPPAEPIHGGRD